MTKINSRIKFKPHVNNLPIVLNNIIPPGADPEILKGGCTKFSGPELPYSGFDPFFEFSVVAFLWKFVLHSRAQPCIRPYGDTHRKTQYLLFWLKTKCLKCYTMYNNTLLNYYPACRSHKQFFLQKTLDPKWMDELGFYVPSTVFQSFRDNGRVNMKDSLQWSAV